MQPVLNIEDVRRVEEMLTEVGVSLSELMHRAGAAAAQEVLRLEAHDSVTIFAGLGNNGGDGWVAAEVLKKHGVAVRIVSPVTPDDIKGDLARMVAKNAEAAEVEIVVAPPRPALEQLLFESDVVVDAIFGTGFHGAPRAPFDIWIECINAAGVFTVSVDVPSGLSAQTGHIDGSCVMADMTVTMLALKPGLISDEGRDACGSIVVASLAEEAEELAVEADPVAWRADASDYMGVFPLQSSSVDKFTRGSVLVVGGSTRYPGAAMMAAMAAARAGAGYVTLAVPADIAGIVQTHMLEIPVVALPCEDDGTFSSEAIELIVDLAENHTAVLVGPGMRVTEDTMEAVTRLLEVDVPLVIDADGLNCLARLTVGRLDEHPDMLRRTSPLVLTPHRGELGRLVGLSETPPDSLTSMLDAARRIVWADGGSEICIIAKGPASACVGVEAAVLPKPGPAALATAGSGDVLGGIVVSLLAQTKVDNTDLPLLAALACEIHGLAGALAVEKYGSRGVMARDVIDGIGLAADALEESIAFAAAEQE